MTRPGSFVELTVGDVRRRVRVRDDGRRDAPAVLIVHGFTGSSDWWDAVVAELGDRVRVVRFDLLGHGVTGGASADAPAQTQVARAVLDRLDLADVTVVGHSFGADVAAALAEDCERVTRVVLVAQAPDYAEARFPRGHMLMTRPLTGRVLLAAGHTTARVVAGVSRVARRPSDPHVRRVIRLGVADFVVVDAAMFRIVLDTRRRRLAARPLDEQLRAAGKPALVVLGGRDGFYGDRSAGRYRAAGARVEVVPDSGHSMQYEYPGLLAGLIAEFATSGSVAAGG